jgi:hypothetical protein
LNRFSWLATDFIAQKYQARAAPGAIITPLSKYRTGSKIVFAISPPEKLSESSLFW